MMFPPETPADNDAGAEVAEVTASGVRPSLALATANTPIDDEPPQPPPERARPSLRIVK
jgi:stringent starvation protein B